MSATNIADMEITVRRLYEAMNTGDGDLVDAALTPDWEAIPLLPHTSAGSAGYRDLIVFLRTVFPDLRVTIEDVVVSGDRAAVRALARGTQSGELLGIPATGRKVEFRAVDFHRVQGGRIAQTWHLEDYFGLLSQLGATFSAAS
jgi:steroid delta-isomerase-like uncharacterized protein